MSDANRFGIPSLGVGVGLRSAHFGHILQHWPKVDWFETISENYMDSRGRARNVIRQVAERYPVVLHGVSLSIGSCDPLNFEYLTKLKRLAEEVGAAWISDHLCWTGLGGHNTHDLLPLPFTDGALQHVKERVRIVQDFLERPIALENPSSYVTFRCSQMSEWEFLARLAEDADCAVLLDVNNVYVSSVNHNFDPQEYLRYVPWNRVVQFHLAGHTMLEGYAIDTHDKPVCSEVWELYGQAWRAGSHVSTLLEWDADIPSFDDMHREAMIAKEVIKGRSRPSTTAPDVTSQATSQMTSHVSRSLVPHPSHSIVLEHESNP